MVVTACGGGDSTEPSELPDPVELPPLETVSYDRLGRGKLAFKRVIFEPAAEGVFVVDAGARTSTASFVGSVISAPAISPDGRRVAYTQLSDLPTVYDAFVANVDGSGSQRISSFPNQEGPPSWTPDGAQVVYVVDATEAAGIYRQTPVANATDRTRIAKIVTAPNAVPCPSSADYGFVSVSVDRRLAFSCNGQAIYTMDEDGQNAVLLTTASARAADTIFRVLTSAWSPDGRRLAFLQASYALGALVRLDVRVIDVAQRTVATLASVPASEPTSLAGTFGTNLSVCWSSVGGWLAFSVPEGHVVSHIYVVDADGTRLGRFTTAPNAHDHSVSCAA